MVELKVVRLHDVLDHCAPRGSTAMLFLDIFLLFSEIEYWAGMLDGRKIPLPHFPR